MVCWLTKLTPSQNYLALAVMSICKRRRTARLQSWIIGDTPRDGQSYNGLVAKLLDVYLSA